MKFFMFFILFLFSTEVLSQSSTSNTEEAQTQEACLVFKAFQEIFSCYISRSTTRSTNIAQKECNQQHQVPPQNPSNDLIQALGVEFTFCSNLCILCLEEIKGRELTDQEYENLDKEYWQCSLDKAQSAQKEHCPNSTSSG